MRHTSERGLRVCIYLGLAGAFLLGACDPISTTGSATYFVITDDCPVGNEPGTCLGYPIERVDVTVSPSAQKVVWKKTQLDGSSADYVTGTGCTVIDGDDFRCAQLAQNKGALLPVVGPDSWPDLMGINVHIDDHFISWILWDLSSAKSHAKVPLSTFNLLATDFGVFLFVGGTAIVIAVLWQIAKAVREIASGGV
jgi:hypothetical protein